MCSQNQSENEDWSSVQQIWLTCKANYAYVVKDAVTRLPHQPVTAPFDRNPHQLGWDRVGRELGANRRTRAGLDLFSLIIPIPMAKSAESGYAIISSPRFWSSPRAKSELRSLKLEVKVIAACPAR
jgi:hypothetical protein